MYTKHIGNLLQFKFSLRQSGMRPESLPLVLLVHRPYCEKQGPKQYVNLSLVWSGRIDVINDHFGGLKILSQQSAGSRTPSHHNKLLSGTAKISSKTTPGEASGYFKLNVQ